MLPRSDTTLLVCYRIHSLRLDVVSHSVHAAHSVIQFALPTAFAGKLPNELDTLPATFLHFDIFTSLHYIYISIPFCPVGGLRGGSPGVRSSTISFDIDPTNPWQLVLPKEEVRLI